VLLEELECLVGVRGFDPAVELVVVVLRDVPVRVDLPAQAAVFIPDVSNADILVGNRSMRVDGNRLLTTEAA
jgi:hypothetical protein